MHPLAAIVQQSKQAPAQDTSKAFCDQVGGEYCYSTGRTDQRREDFDEFSRVTLATGAISFFVGGLAALVVVPAIRGKW
jgi:hypothetical protein